MLPWMSYILYCIIDYVLVYTATFRAHGQFAPTVLLPTVLHAVACLETSIHYVIYCLQINRL
jgi:hypothetical protein